MPGPRMTTEVTAFTVARHAARWLMVRHERLGVTSWELPGGHVEPGESLEQTAERETLEETGVRVVCGDLLALCTHEWPERGERKLIAFFDAEPAGDDQPLAPPGEPQLVEAAWRDPLDLRPETVSPFLVPLLEQERTGRDDLPLHYRMTHRRNESGFWVPGPA